MKALSKLHDILNGIHEKQGSGRIYLNYENDGKKCSVVLTAKDGELMRARYSSGKSFDSLDEMLSLPVEQVVFMDSRGGGHILRKDDWIPEMPELLDRLDESLGIEISRKVEEYDEQMEEEVSAMMMKLFGPSIVPKLESIKEKYPPQFHAKSFLDKCRELLGIMLGDGKAKQMMEPLYTRYIKE